jgi:hypothetical protein
VAALCGPERDPDGVKQARARFLVPTLNGFTGWAAFVSSDMLFQADIYELWSLRDDRFAVMSVAAEMNGRGQSAPRSSLLLWNCGHPANRVLTPELVAATDLDRLNRFGWLDRDMIGSFPAAWSWRDGLSDPNLTPKAIEFMPAKPWLNGAEFCRYADRWLNEAERIFGPPSCGIMGRTASA